MRSLTNTFQYADAIYAYENFDIDDLKTSVLNPNLDAGLPVILRLRADEGQHAAVCDGYGFNAETLYHHLNLGWNDENNVWYNLPNADTPRGITFTTVFGCYFNIYTNGTGEIISGRVTDADGTTPLANVTVQARADGEILRTTTTDVHGIYAFPGVSQNTQYTLSASLAEHGFQDRVVETGQTSRDNGALEYGNRWGIDFVNVAGDPPEPPGNVFASDDRTDLDGILVTWGWSANATAYRVYRATNLWVK